MQQKRQATVLVAAQLFHFLVEVCSFVSPPLLPTAPRPAVWSSRVALFSNAVAPDRAGGFVPRKELQDITPQDIQALESGEGATPMIVSNVWGHSEEDLEAWCEGLMEHLSGEPVEFQLQRPDGSFMFEESWEDFLECVFESRHDASYLLFDENLLADATTLTNQLTLPSSHFSEDLFGLFPEPLRPKASCLVAGGRASRSKLHADPFEWVGWNYCLEGSKLWTFFPPQPPDVERELGVYRLEPNAWDGGVPELAEFSIAAGWQSDVDIYRGLLAEARDGEEEEEEGPAAGWPSARALAELMPRARAAALRRVEEEAVGLVRGGAWGGAVGAGEVTVGVQGEGELVLIPPGWWHQTYHLQPSLALASQYTSPANLPRVLRHVARWTGAPPQELEALRGGEGRSAREAVAGVLGAAVERRCGEQSRANAALRRLWTPPPQP